MEEIMLGALALNESCNVRSGFSRGSMNSGHRMEKPKKEKKYMKGTKEDNVFPLISYFCSTWFVYPFSSQYHTNLLMLKPWLLIVTKKEEEKMNVYTYFFNMHSGSN